MRILARTGIAVGILVVLVIGAIVALYVWPVQSGALQSGPGAKTYSFSRAVALARAKVRADAKDPAVAPGCGSMLYEHGHKTRQSVLLLHGYTSCPSQFQHLARQMYDDGYNVYVPRAPENGLRDSADSAHVTAPGLVSYASKAVAIVGGLGTSSGVIGLSGGGVLATWAAYYRPAVIHRLLVLSPFYSPNASKAAAWEIKPMIILYGKGILPDKTGFGFSYHGLAQYLEIAKNFPDRTADQLKDAALVVSHGDEEINKGVARQTMRIVDPHTRVYEPPTSWDLGHDIVTPKGLHGHTAQLYGCYIGLYQGRAGC